MVISNPNQIHYFAFHLNNCRRARQLWNPSYLSTHTTKRVKFNTNSDKVFVYYDRKKENQANSKEGEWTPPTGEVMLTLAQFFERMDRITPNLRGKEKEFLYFSGSFDDFPGI